MILSQGDSRGWFISLCKLTLLCTGLWSATCEFTSQSKTICLLLFMFWNPTYFGVVAFLLQGHAEQSIVVASLGSVWTHLLELICHQFLVSACRHLLQFLQQRSVWTRPNQLLQSTETDCFSLKWGITWNSFYPILHSASRKMGSVLPLRLWVQFCHLLPFHKWPWWLAIT